MFRFGRSGNTISFIMEHEKYSYVEALKWLATKYGIEIQETFATDEQRMQMQQLTVFLSSTARSKIFHHAIISYR